ncbi:MAG: TonB-dependent receptor [Saprospiraceae bacterium]|nr:TonB-dependent receptor [Saprospiraceae bacterium]
MKKQALLFIALIYSSTIFSQVTIQGRIADEKQQPVPFASVALIAAKDSHLIKGALTDESGVYAIPSVSAGSFRILTTTLGFEKNYSPVFDLSAENKNATIDVTLKVASQMLDAAVVTATRPLFEQKADKLVMNVANSPVAAGGTVMEILTKIPGVIVMNEQVRLSNNQTPQIWIDGKPSQYADVNAALRDMPGDQVDRIEVITQPGAKFDAAGGPILNIILKRDAELGFTGTASMTIGGSRYDQSEVNQGTLNYYRLVPSLNLNYRGGGWNVFGSYSFANRRSFNAINVSRFIGDEVYKQDNYTGFGVNFHNYRLGADYFVSKKTTVGVILRGWSRDATNEGSNLTDVFNKDETQLLQSFFTNSDLESDRLSYATNANLKHEFNPKTGHALNFDVDYSHFDTRDITNYLIFKNEPNSVRSPSQQNLVQPIDIWVGKIDYTLPIDSTFKIETGAKSSFAAIDNDLKFYRGVELQPNQSNDFLYKENINAGYVNVSKTIGKVELNGGLRAEQTVVKGTSMTKSVLDRNYLQWFPSASALYRLNKNMGIQASYSKRVNRPSFQQQNPFAFFIDSLTFQQGNPSLLPEITHTAQIAVVYDNQPFVSIARTRTNDVIIENAPRLEGTKTFTQAANLANFDNWTFQLNFPIKYKKIIEGFGGNQLIYNALDVPYLGSNFKQSKWHWLGYVGITANLPLDMKLEVNGFYLTQFLDEFFLIDNVRGLNLGLSKTFAEKRGRVSLNFSDIFYSQRPTASIDYQNIRVNFAQRFDSRNLRLTFSYQFGNTKVKSRKRNTASETETSRIKIE